MNPAVHSLKTWPGPYQALLDGRKTFEYRRDDRGFEVGDILHLREYDSHADHYSGRNCWTRVSYILRGAHGVPDGFVVMGIEPIRRRRDGWEDMTKARDSVGTCEPEEGGK